MRRDCPTDDELKAFASGHVGGRTPDAIADHVEHCADCRVTVDELERSGDTLISALQVVGEQTFSSADAALLKALNAAKDLAPSGATSSNGGRREERRRSMSLPQIVRDYELLEPLGRGGMGDVFRARHRKLQRFVAVKLIAGHRFGDEAAARFRREMEAAGRLDHPNIVRALDAGEEDGLPYFVMEFVSGLTTAELVRQIGPLCVSDACELVRQATLGLQHAHDNGLVHRDIKPSNLMLADDGCVKIVDFGLARVIERAAGDAELTSEEHILGTLDFMAPEQCEASSDVDIRADLYSLGCTLYFLLSGRPPFAAPAYDSPFKKMKAHAEANAPTLRDQREDLPTEVEGIVHKLLQKKREDRFDTPTSVGDALRPFCSEADLSALVDARERMPFPESVASSSRAGGKPRRLQKIVVAVLLVMLAAGCFAAPKLWWRLRAGRRSPDWVQQKTARIESPRAAKLATNADSLDSVSQPLSPIALVTRPTWFGGDIVSWTVETYAHRGSIADIAFSPDSSWLASGGFDGAIRIWNRSDQQLDAVLTAHPSRITSLDWSPDGKKLATGSHDGTAIVWEVKTWKQRDRFVVEGELTALAWSPDNQQLATNAYQAVQVRTPSSSEPAKSFDGPAETVSDLVWLDQGRKLAASSYDNSIWIWDVADGRLLDTLTEHKDRTWALAVDENGKRVASASWDDTVRIWNREHGTSKVVSKHTSDVWDVAWSPQGEQLVSAGRDGDLRIWNASTEQSIQKRSGHTGRVSCVAWSPDGKTIASSDEFGELRLWGGETLEPAGIIAGHDVAVNELRWNSDNQRLRIIGRDRVPRDWVIEAGTVTSMPASASDKLAWSADGTRTARASQGRLIRLGDADGQDTGEVLVGHTAGLLGMSWSPDEKHLVSGSQDRTARIWDVQTQTCINVIDQHTSSVNCVAWGPNIAYIATGGDDATHIWNAETFEHVSTIHSPAFVVAWSPDGKRLAIGESWLGMSVELWSTESWALLMEFSAGTRIDSLAWSPTGDSLAAGDVNGEVHLFDASSGQHGMSLRLQANSVSALVWLDDERLATASRDGVVRICNGRTGRVHSTLLVLSGGQHAVFDPSGPTLLSPLAESQLVAVGLDENGHIVMSRSISDFLPDLEQPARPE